IQRLGDLRLELVLQGFVHGLAANVDIDFDAVPGGVVGLEGSLRACDIARLQGGDGVDQGRPDGLDAGDLEALTLRKRLTRGAGDGQRCDDSKAKLTNFLPHVGAPPCAEASKVVVRKSTAKCL